MHHKHSQYFLFQGNPSKSSSSNTVFQICQNFIPSEFCPIQFSTKILSAFDFVKWSQLRVLYSGKHWQDKTLVNLVNCWHNLLLSQIYRIFNIHLPLFLHECFIISIISIYVCNNLCGQIKDYCREIYLILPSYQGNIKIMPGKGGNIQILFRKMAFGYLLIHHLIQPFVSRLKTLIPYIRSS